jgi:ubiquinone/menaquinone biosynthesis C-methylase UbiE
MKIPQTDEQKIIAMYEGRYSLHGYAPESLGWTKGKQDIRFEVLLSAFDCENRSILDVGCGFGDLNRLLRARYKSYHYHGIDMIQDFVAEARKHYGNMYVTFSCGEFLKMDLPKTFDFGVACGIFNYKFLGIDNYEYVDQVLKKMFEICNDSVALDFLSDQVNFKREHCFYNNLERILAIVRKYTRNFVLRSDYMPFEYALLLFKDDSYDDADTIFNRYKREIKNY